MIFARECKTSSFECISYPYARLRSKALNCATSLKHLSILADCQSFRITMLHLRTISSSYTRKENLFIARFRACISRVTAPTPPSLKGQFTYFCTDTRVPAVASNWTGFVENSSSLAHSNSVPSSFVFFLRFFLISSTSPSPYKKLHIFMLHMLLMIDLAEISHN